MSEGCHDSVDCRMRWSLVGHIVVSSAQNAHQVELAGTGPLCLGPAGTLDGSGWPLSEADWVLWTVRSEKVCPVGSLELLVVPQVVMQVAPELWLVEPVALVQPLADCVQGM